MRPYGASLYYVNDIRTVCVPLHGVALQQRRCLLQPVLDRQKLSVCTSGGLLSRCKLVVRNDLDLVRARRYDGSSTCAASVRVCNDA